MVDTNCVISHQSSVVGRLLDGPRASLPQPTGHYVVQRHGGRAEGGFSLIEILVGLAIVVVLAAVITPNLVGMLDDARVDRAISSLENLSDGVIAFEEDVKRYPASLSQLSTPVESGEEDSCGATFPPGLANQWAGPYLNRLVPETGVPIAIGIARNGLERTGQGNRGEIRIVVEGATEIDAIELNRRVDGDDDSGANAVQWTAADEQGLVTIHYVTPVKGC